MLSGVLVLSAPRSSFCETANLQVPSAALAKECARSSWRNTGHCSQRIEGRVDRPEPTLHHRSRLPATFCVVRTFATDDRHDPADRQAVRRASNRRIPSRADGSPSSAPQPPWCPCEASRRHPLRFGMFRSMLARSACRVHGGAPDRSTADPRAADSQHRFTVAASPASCASASRSPNTESSIGRGRSCASTRTSPPLGRARECPRHNRRRPIHPVPPRRRTSHRIAPSPTWSNRCRRWPSR